MYLLPQRSTELVVVHVWLGLPLAPPPCHLVRVRELELPIGALPCDAASVARVTQEF